MCNDTTASDNNKQATGETKRKKIAAALNPRETAAADNEGIARTQIDEHRERFPGVYLRLGTLMENFPDIDFIDCQQCTPRLTIRRNFGSVVIDGSDEEELSIEL